MVSSSSPRKRLSAELNPTDLPLRNTRRKPSPPPSSTTTSSVAASEDTPNSTTEATEYSGDSDSSTLSASSPEPSSSSSDEDSSDEESDVESNKAASNITSLPLPPNRQARQQMYRETEATLAADRVSLRERLHTFLPQLAAANASLEEDRAAGRLEDRVFDAVKDGEEMEGKQYIEMNLGLGVLEEKDPNKMDDSDEDDDEDDEMDQTMAGAGDSSASAQKEKDVMGKLLGQKGRKPGGGGIEEVSDQ
ncbi:hypothetical protein K490DRAFT_69252 [Saccharata proteae CBS 121410]|uniref:Uncharacterized protein n=1 Tax=Saccharata proteae CBS 121410 TaxID=1314787 RepID=A0A9P4HRF4_9PEZI|nr:hypothetical protein K490DRAFT_69252 [Saccharata proteae CBS 121410]